MIYEKPLSENVKRLMFQIMKQSTHIVQGFIFFRNRTIIKAHYDEEPCSELLKSMIINRDNVLTYLKRKYIPTWNENGATFKDQSCIQKVKIMPDKTLYMHIKNSEPHKIITDTIHIMRLLKEHGFEFKEEIKYYIEILKIAYQDTLLYNMCLVEFGYKVPSPARIYERQLKTKFGNMYSIVKIKKRSVKRKFLRYYVKRGEIDWKQLRKVVNMESTDYTPIRINQIVKELRAESIDKGYTITY